MYLNTEYNSETENNHHFLSGMLIGVAVSIDFSAIILLPYAIIVLLINFFSKKKEFSLLILGIIMFFFYLGIFYFFTDHLTWFFDSIKSIRVFQLFEKETLSIIQWIFLILSFLLLVFFLIKIKVQYENKIIVMRKRLTTLVVLFVVVFFTLLFTRSTYPTVIQYFIVPIALILGMNTLNKGKFIFPEIFTALIIIGLCI